MFINKVSLHEGFRNIAYLHIILGSGLFVLKDVVNVKYCTYYVLVWFLMSYLSCCRIGGEGPDQVLLKKTT
jgi:hypothetical protein